VPRTAPLARARRALSRRDAAVAVAFCAAYLLLDWLSYIRPMQTLGITPWNPQPALAVALLVLHGQRWFPVVLVAILGAEILVRDAPTSAPATFVIAGVLTTGYAAIAYAVAGPFAVRRSLDAARDVVRLIVVVAAGTCATALLYVAVLSAFAVRLEQGSATAALKFWIGDCVGILVTLPLIFLLLEPARRAALRQLFRQPETIAQGLAIALALWLVFGALGGEPFKYFYLLFLPLVWVAARDGLAGAVLALALIEWAIIVAVEVGGAPTLTVFELQALQIALTITGLFLGVTVDERERAARALRQSSRLAAAGSMAGALVHELSQPLTALTGYAKAARMLAAAQPSEPQRLDEALRKVVGEADRAGAVLQKVREFFQTGTPQRTATDLAELTRDVIAALQPRATRESVEIVLHAPPAPIAPALDRAQMELVLRNLLVNAIEAAAAPGAAAPRRVSVDIARASDRAVRLRVLDSGAGVPPEVTDQVFEPFFTRKATGMGMGLAISRAIVQAHRGRLEAGRGPGGDFILELPCPADAVAPGPS
jgi:two-component system, LuxR family, sensor kinase FixL